MFGGGGYGSPFGGAGGAAFGAGGFGAHMMGGRRFGADASAYTEYLTAYSMAMLPGQERENVSYGGKIMLPSSALLQLTDLDVEAPWFFQLRNPNPNVPPKDTIPLKEGADTNSDGTFRGPPLRESHGGVWEFIAEEGRVHLPAWMMRSLALNEGDKVKVQGTTLPKGKMVKIQPQTVDFLEISDPKAVLEQALRNFATLTPGDIIEFKYNCLTFEVLIMEVTPDAAAIAIVDTDLEVDFAPPKGYVEPVRQPKAPLATMASKLKIETGATDSIPPSGTVTPRSNDTGNATPEDASASAAGAGAGAVAGPFRGSGQTLSGRKSKGKKEKAVEQLDPFSMVRRTDQPKIITNDTVLEEKKIPAALNLEFGRLFFGYEYIPPGGKPDENKENSKAKQISFSGTGVTLSGRAPRRRVEEPTASASPAPASQPREEASETDPAPATPAPFTGSGNVLGGARLSVKRPRESQSTSERGSKLNAIEID